MVPKAENLLLKSYARCSDIKVDVLCLLGKNKEFNKTKYIYCIIGI